MFCSKCGNQVADGAAFCDKCGNQLNAQPQQPYQAPAQPQQPYQASAQPQQPYQAPAQPQYDPNFAPQQAPYGFAPLGMKWYKFLIYFLLFAAGILNIIGGIVYLTGGQYGSALEAKLVYAVFSNLKTMDIVYGIVCIALGVFQIYTRFQLASYKAKAPSYILYMYVINGAATAIYSFVVSGMIDVLLPAESAQLSGQAIGAILGAALFVWLNKIYFDKRKHLFVNQ